MLHVDLHFRTGLPDEVRCWSLRRREVYYRARVVLTLPAWSFFSAVVASRLPRPLSADKRVSLAPSDRGAAPPNERVSR